MVQNTIAIHPSHRLSIPVNVSHLALYTRETGVAWQNYAFLTNFRNIIIYAFTSAEHFVNCAIANYRNCQKYVAKTKTVSEMFKDIIVSYPCKLHYSGGTPSKFFAFAKSDVCLNAFRWMCESCRLRIGQLERPEQAGVTKSIGRLKKIRVISILFTNC